ncbi:MAG: glycosyltransferase family 4 protein [Deltaproteobacteria bacterium]|nr:glycosyltransferase family 4 protein [Deltaproteobacteria bacterium]
MVGDRPRLLFVVTEDWYFLSHRLALAHAASRAGYRVAVATAPGPKVSQITAAGFEHFALPSMTRGGTNPLFEALNVVELARVFRRYRPDLVHLVAIKPTLYGSIAARLVAVPAVICAFAGMGYLFTGQSLKRQAMRMVAEAGYRYCICGRENVSVILQNRDDRHFFVERGFAHAEQIHLICGSGVDIARFSPPEAVAEGAPVVICHSRMLWDKGIGELVEAARILRQRGRDFRLLLVGASDPENPAAVPDQTLQNWHNEGVVEYLGRRDDIPELLARSHIACLPSYREGAPLSLIEAAACGLPIVSCDVPGCREVVEHRENGLLVPKQQAAALAQALDQLLVDRALRQRMGRASRRIAEQRLADHRVHDETLALYRTALSRCRA